MPPILRFREFSYTLAVLEMLSASKTSFAGPNYHLPLPRPNHTLWEAFPQVSTSNLPSFLPCIYPWLLLLLPTIRKVFIPPILWLPVLLLSPLPPSKEFLPKHTITAKLLWEIPAPLAASCLNSHCPLCDFG
jgi:hypothetical protein